MSFFKGSPYRRHNNNNDAESGGGSRGDEEDEESSSNPFDITSTKNASIARLKKWRVRFFFFFSTLFLFLANLVFEIGIVHFFICFVLLYFEANLVQLAK